MSPFLLCIIISTCIPLVLCKPTVIDDFAAPKADFSEFPLTNTQDIKFDDSSSSVYGAPRYEPPQYKLITKNIYIHIPPAEEPEYQPVQTFEKSIPKTHYNIVFIKAPTPPTPTAPVIPEPIQDEHKTLVYVLVKKPDPQPKIELPQVKATEPTKPEVFFVKYKEDGENVSKEYGLPH